MKQSYWRSCNFKRHPVILTQYGTFHSVLLIIDFWTSITAHLRMATPALIIPAPSTNGKGHCCWILVFLFKIKFNSLKCMTVWSAKYELSLLCVSKPMWYIFWNSRSVRWPNLAFCLPCFDVLYTLFRTLPQNFKDWWRVDKLWWSNWNLMLEISNNLTCGYSWTTFFTWRIYIGKITLNKNWDMTLGNSKRSCSKNQNYWNKEILPSAIFINLLEKWKIYQWSLSTFWKGLINYDNQLL